MKNFEKTIGVPSNENFIEIEYKGSTRQEFMDDLKELRSLLGSGSVVFDGVDLNSIERWVFEGESLKDPQIISLRGLANAYSENLTLQQTLEKIERYKPIPFEVFTSFIVNWWRDPNHTNPISDKNIPVVFYVDSDYLRSFIKVDTDQDGRLLVSNLNKNTLLGKKELLFSGY